MFLALDLNLFIFSREKSSSVFSSIIIIDNGQCGYLVKFKSFIFYVLWDHFNLRSIFSHFNNECEKDRNVN
jgi:hypothetical protein